MIVFLQRPHSSETRALISGLLVQRGVHEPLSLVETQQGLVCCIAARLSADDAALFMRLPGVEGVVPLATPYQLVSRQFQADKTVVQVGNPGRSNVVKIGAGRPVIIAGPCAVEDAQQLQVIAGSVARAGATILRGGAFKPRTSPYTFQGLGIPGLKLLAEAREESGLPIVTEVMEPAMVEVVAEYADLLQIGCRNMQNFPLLKAAGQIGKPVLLKRGFSATIEEWLLSAEYILSEGNPNVVLCERGIRSFDPHTRNLLDLSCIPLLGMLTHLPVVVDPSHATGRHKLVGPMAHAAIAAGADALLIDVHHQPEAALCDGDQALLPEALTQIVSGVHLIHQAIQAVSLVPV